MSALLLCIESFWLLASRTPCILVSSAPGPVQNGQANEYVGRKPDQGTRVCTAHVHKVVRGCSRDVFLVRDLFEVFGNQVVHCWHEHVSKSWQY